MTIAAHWTPEHRAKNDQEYGCLAPDPDVYEAPIETWATKLETCMETAGLDAVKQAACEQEALANTNGTTANRYIEQDIEDRLTQLKEQNIIKEAADKMKVCDSKVAGSTEYDDCKAGVETDIKDIMTELGIEEDASFDIEKEANLGKSNAAADALSDCLKDLKDLPMEDEHDQNTRVYKENECYKNAEHNGYDAMAEADAWIQEEEANMDKVTDRLSSSLGDGTKLDMENEDDQHKYEEEREKLMDQMPDLFTQVEAGADDKTKELNDLKNEAKFETMVEENGVKKVGDLFPTTAEIEAGTATAPTTDQIRQQYETATGQTTSDLEINNIVKKAKETATHDVVDSIVDSGGALEEIKAGIRTRLEGMEETGTANTVTTRTVNKMFQASMKATVGVELLTLKRAADGGETTTSAVLRLNKTLTALQRIDPSATETDAIGMVEDFATDNYQSCMEKIANRDACAEELKTNTGFAVKGSKAKFTKIMNRARTTRMFEDRQLCMKDFKVSGDTAKKEKCMQDVRATGQKLTGSSTPMTATTFEKEAKQGAVTEVAGLLAQCHADTERTDSDCEDESNVAVAESMGIAEDEVTKAIIQEYLNDGQTILVADNTRKCRTAAGTDEAKKAACIELETLAEEKSKMTGQDPKDIEGADNVMFQTQMHLQAYTEAAKASAEESMESVGRRLTTMSAGTIEMLREDTGKDYSKPEAELSLKAMQEHAGGSQVAQEAQACVSAGTDADTCEANMLKEFKDVAGMTTSNGGKRRRRMTSLDGVQMKHAGAKILIEKKVRACSDSGSRLNELTECVSGSKKTNDEYELLVSNKQQDNTVRQTVSTMAAQRELDCRTAGGTEEDCKQQGENSLKELKYSAPEDQTEGKRTQEDYKAARARLLYQKFNSETKCSSSSEDACKASIEADAEKLGYPKSQVDMLRVQAFKSLAGQEFSDNKQLGMDSEDAMAKAKLVYVNNGGTSEDFEAKKTAIQALGEALQNGDATEIRTSDDEVDTMITTPTGCTADSIETNRKQIKQAANNAITIVVSQPTDLKGNCQVVYKSKVTKGTASTVSEGIATALSRRRLLLQSRALNGGRDISSSPAQEEVKYGETSTQEYNEPEENPEKNVEGKGTGDTKDTDEEGTGVDSDSVEGEGQLSLGWSMHGSTTVALMWTLGAMVFTVFM